jgi:hypothetical protein
MEELHSVCEGAPSTRKLMTALTLQFNWMQPVFHRPSFQSGCKPKTAMFGAFAYELIGLAMPALCPAMAIRGTAV